MLTINPNSVKLEPTGPSEGKGSVGEEKIPSTVNKNVYKKVNKPRKKKKQRRKEIINSFNSNSLKSATASMLKINGEETECLIDTGAYTSFISHEYWKKRKFSNTKLTTRKNWVTANGTPIEVAGQTQLGLVTMT